MRKGSESFPACLRFTLAGFAVAILLNFLAFQDSDLGGWVEALEAPFLRLAGFLRREYGWGPRGEAGWLFAILVGALQWPFLGLVADGVRGFLRGRGRSADPAGAPAGEPR